MSTGLSRVNTKGLGATKVKFSGSVEDYTYEGWNFNSGNYLFTTDTK